MQPAGDLVLPARRHLEARAQEQPSPSHPREQQRAPDLFGYSSFYGWSEDKARQAAQPEGEGFPTFLRKCGFSLD